MIRKRFRVLAAAAVTALAAGCDAPSVSLTDTTAASPSACTFLGGVVDPGHICRFHSVTSRYTLDFKFPTDYPDQQTLASVVTQERDSFIEWVAKDTSPHSYALDISGQTYQSGTPQPGTRSLVLTIGSDTGIHPVMTFRALNFDLKTGTPITFDTLFKPDARPLDVLNPIVERQIDEHGGPSALSLNDFGTKAYQNFAITDDAVTFFFDQDGLLEHTAGPLKVRVARADIASLLA